MEGELRGLGMASSRIPLAPGLVSGLLDEFKWGLLHPCLGLLLYTILCPSQPSRINLTYLLMTATRGQLGCPVLIYWPCVNVAESVIALRSNLQGDLLCCAAEMWYFLSSVSGKIAMLYKQSLGIVCSITPSFHVVFAEFTSQNTSAHSSAS